MKVVLSLILVANPVFAFWAGNGIGTSVSTSISCSSKCGDAVHEEGESCYCDHTCGEYSDCCIDFTTECVEEATKMAETLKKVVPGSGTCKDKCGSQRKAHDGLCYCDSTCEAAGDCCADFKSECPGIQHNKLKELSCVGKCGKEDVDSDGSCKCDFFCEYYNDCCSDRTSVCASADEEVADEKMKSLSCDGQCGGFAAAEDGTYECYCDAYSYYFGDACVDFVSMCPDIQVDSNADSLSCEDHCGDTVGTYVASCHCDKLCTFYADCCNDFTDKCAPADAGKEEVELSCGTQCDGARGNYVDMCHCDATCQFYNDCCDDWTETCGKTAPKPAAETLSCEGSCDGYVGNEVGSCHCDKKCSYHGDCCWDFTAQCSDKVTKKKTEYSCKGHCGQFFGKEGGKECFCNELCSFYGDCCADFSKECSEMVKSNASPFAASCTNHCGDQVGTFTHTCYCDMGCIDEADCCDDFTLTCKDHAARNPLSQLSCESHCGDADVADFASCYCNEECVKYGDCCPDYTEKCAKKESGAAEATEQKRSGVRGGQTEHTKDQTSPQSRSALDSSTMEEDAAHHHRVGTRRLIPQLAQPKARKLMTRLASSTRMVKRREDAKLMALLPMNVGKLSKRQQAQLRKRRLRFIQGKYSTKILNMRVTADPDYLHDSARTGVDLQGVSKGSEQEFGS